MFTKYILKGFTLLVFCLAVTACGGKSASALTLDQTSFSGSTPSSTTATPAFVTNNLQPIDLPYAALDQEGNVNSSAMATAKQKSGSEHFVWGIFERPFNANTMDTYFPQLDIVQIRGFKDSTWGYAAITMAGTDQNGKLPAQYAVELDLNKDGRGDWLIRASNPSSTTWAAQGVQAWKDANGDVGGQKPMLADHSPSGDGYETLVFDQGTDSLMDGAWVRIDPKDSNTVQIAFKLSMLGNPNSFAMGGWTGTAIDPAMFDYNDHLTHAQAGSATYSYPLYPIKALAEINNTCRLAIGFDPSPYSAVSGLCTTVVLVKVKDKQEDVTSDSGGDTATASYRDRNTRSLDSIQKPSEIVLPLKYPR